MPTIDITDEQAAALARGESISIEPEPVVKHFIVVRPEDGWALSIEPEPVVKHFIVVRPEDGWVVEYETIDGKPQPWTCVRSPYGYPPVGLRAHMGYDFTQ